MTFVELRSVSLRNTIENAYLVVERPQEGTDHIQGDEILYEFGMGRSKGSANASAHRVPN